MKNNVKFIANTYNNLLSANGRYEDDQEEGREEESVFLLLEQAAFMGGGERGSRESYFLLSQKGNVYNAVAFLWVAVESDKQPL